MNWPCRIDAPVALSENVTSDTIVFSSSTWPPTPPRRVRQLQPTNAARPPLQAQRAYGATVDTDGRARRRVRLDLRTPTRCAQRHPRALTLPRSGTVADANARLARTCHVQITCDSRDSDSATERRMALAAARLAVWRAGRLRPPGLVRRTQATAAAAAVSPPPPSEAAALATRLRSGPRTVDAATLTTVVQVTTPSSCPAARPRALTPTGHTHTHTAATAGGGRRRPRPRGPCLL
jgi:hypothetical protein